MVEEITRHRGWLKQNANWEKKERQRIRADMVSLLTSKLLKQWLSDNPDGSMELKIDQVIERKLSPYQAVEELLDNY